MSELTKQALKVENNTNFPNNNTGYITPALLREFNTDMIDSTVNQGGYNTDSGSWNQSITSLNQFTASASGLSTGSLLVTASATSNVITFTKGDASQFSVTVADTTNLAPLNSFTASAQISLNNLNTWTSSYQPVITNLEASQSVTNTKFNTIGGQSGSWDNTNLNAYTASNNTKWDNLGAQSGSFVTESETSSFARTNTSNTFTSANTFTSISASSFVSASEFIGNGSKITGITASVSLPILDEGIPQGNAVSMNFTGSGISATIVGGTAIVSVNTPDSGTVNNLTASFNSYTASNNQKWDNIALQSGSWGANDLTSLNAFTASQETKNTTLASVTASLQQQLTNIGSQSGSWITESETGSFARTDVTNTFTQPQIISAAVTASAARIANLNYPTADNGAESFIQTDGAGNLSLQYVKTIYQNIRNRESTTIVKGTPLFVSGSTGDNADVFIADAGNPLRMPATLVAGDNTLAAGATGKGIIFGHIDGVNTTGYPAGTEVFVGVGGGWTATRPTGSATPVQPLGVVTREGSNGMGIVLTQVPFDLPNLQTGYAWVGNGNNQPLAVATSSFASLINTGSFATTGSNTFNGTETVSGNVLVSGSVKAWGPGYDIVAGTYDTNYYGVALNLTPDLKIGDVQVGGQDVAAVEMFAAAGNYDTLRISVNSGSQGILFQDFPAGAAYSTWMNVGTSADLSNLGEVTLNRNTNISGNLDIQSTLTASLQQGYVWVGDANGKTTTVATSSFGTTINTGSFATTGSNTFIGNQIITGSFLQSGSNSFVVDPIGQGVGTWIQNRVLISNNPGQPTPRLFISGSDGAFTEMGRGFITQDTRAVSALSANIYSISNITNASQNTVAVANNDYSVDVEMQMFANTSSVGLADWDNVTAFTYVPFMTLEPNLGNNPAPQFKRSVGITGSLDLSSTLTASLQQGYVWVGNANGRTTTVATSSFGGGGGFPYTGNAVITGSLGISGSMFGGVIALSVATATASVDFSAANMFTLTLPSASTHINPTNIRAGQTVNIQITQPTPGTGSVTFPSNVKFAGGNDYQATATGSAIDMLTLVSYDGVNVLATSIKNFL